MGYGGNNDKDYEEDTLVPIIESIPRSLQGVQAIFQQIINALASLPLIPAAAYLESSAKCIADVSRLSEVSQLGISASSPISTNVCD